MTTITAIPEIIEDGQVGINYEYTACTLDSEVPEADLTYEWSVMWQQAENTYENFQASEIQSANKRVVTVKFLNKGTYTLRCLVKAKDANPAIGVFAENVPSHPVLYEWFTYTACTPDTQMEPQFLEYLWIITSEVDGKWVDAKDWIETPVLNGRLLPIKFNYPGRYKLEAVVFSPMAEDVLQQAEICEEIEPIEKIGDVEIVRGKNRRFAAVHKDATAPQEHMKYLWECEGATVELANQRVCRITFEDYKFYTVKVTVSNPWAVDSPVVATWLVEHSHPHPPETVLPNWKRPILGARISRDNHEFIGHPVHGQNYNPHSQANRFWKIWMDDIQNYSKKMCLDLNDEGDVIWHVLDYQHPNIEERWVSVELVNIGTGNQFEDDHMDVRLYTIEKEEHPYNYMYVPAHRYFFLGVHRRETTKLPFDIAIRLGKEYLKLKEIAPENRKYIMNVHDVSPHW